MSNGSIGTANIVAGIKESGNRKGGVEIWNPELEKQRLGASIQDFRRGVVPEGLNESSPVRSAGWCKKNHPSRTGRSKPPYAGEAAYETTKSQNTSIVPPGRTSLFASFPSTSYWATFIGSLRDRLVQRFCISREHVRSQSRALMLTRMLRCRASCKKVGARCAKIQGSGNTPPKN